MFGCMSEGEMERVAGEMGKRNIQKHKDGM